MVEDIFSVYFNDWKSIFTFFFVKATSLVHDLKKKKQKKKDKRETHWGGIKTSSWFKTWNYYKNTTESNRWSVKHLCTVHQEQNHGIHLTEKSVWRWRPYVNCIIVNKLNLVKLSSACLWLMCRLFFYNLCPLAFKVYLLNVDIKCNFASSRFKVSVSFKSLVARCRHFQNIWLAFIIIHVFHHGISGDVWVLLLKDDQSVWWICRTHTFFFCLKVHKASWWANRIVHTWQELWDLCSSNHQLEDSRNSAGDSENHQLFTAYPSWLTTLFWSHSVVTLSFNLFWGVWWGYGVMSPSSGHMTAKLSGLFRK